MLTIEPTVNTVHKSMDNLTYMRVGTLIVATIYLQLIQNRYMFRKIDTCFEKLQGSTCFEVLLSFSVVTSIVYNHLPAMWKS